MMYPRSLSQTRSTPMHVHTATLPFVMEDSICAVVSNPCLCPPHTHYFNISCHPLLEKKTGNVIYKSCCLICACVKPIYEDFILFGTFTPALRPLFLNASLLTYTKVGYCSVWFLWCFGRTASWQTNKPLCLESVFELLFQTIFSQDKSQIFSKLVHPRSLGRKRSCCGTLCTNLSPGRAFFFFF